MYKGKLDWAEQRYNTRGLYEYAKNDTVNLIDDSVIQQAKKSPTHPVKIPVVNGMTMTVTSTRSITVTNKDSTTAFSTLTYSTYCVAFDMKPAIYPDNYVGYMTDFKRKMDIAQNAILDSVEGALYTKSDTDKSQYNAADLNPYTLVGNEFIIDYANREDVFNEIGPIYKTNKFNDVSNLTFIANPRTEALIKKIEQSAAYNAENKAMVLANKKFLFSNAITNSSPSAYTMFSLLPGSIGMTNWNDNDAQMNMKGENGEVTIAYMPLMGMDCAVFQRRYFYDGSGSYTGKQRTMLEGFEISTDIALVTPYLSAPTTNASPIFKIRINAA